MPESSRDKGNAAISGNRSVLSIASPTKLNILSSDWSRNQGKVSKNSLKRSSSLNIRNSKRPSLQASANSIYSRPKITIGAPPLIRRDSSFFKDEFDAKKDKATFSAYSSRSYPTTGSDSVVSQTSLSQPTTSREVDEQFTVAADRYIPILQGASQNKVDPETLHEALPPPNASPISHLRAQTKIVFKQNVAEACGLDMNKRILQYMPEPPKCSSLRQKSYIMKKRTHYSYQQEQKIPDLIKLRKINTNPERILDAPGFQDDFYLNLLSWSKKNVLAIALDTALYLWNATTGDVSLLTDFENTTICSVTWSDDDCHISIGKEDGNTEIWDVETMSLIRTMRSGLGVRIGSLSWLDTLIATGSRSGEIQINDVRIKQHIVSTWAEHTGEVCGLSYKSDGLQLASGGNDNTVMIWDTRTSLPQFSKKTHSAAVKALSWCPYSPNILASGGGQTDKHIHFWNSITGARVGSINTGSQVSSLHWGQSHTSTNGGMMNKEIVATGGNPENAISVYNYETKFKVAEVVHAHEARICCSQLSPDGTTLATVGGDENLKFYKIFDPRCTGRSREDGLMDGMLGLIGKEGCRTNDKENRSKNSSEIHTRRPSSTSQYLIR
ncbi:anaphase promoting complex (APC) subunit [Saccharomyces cerevisiae YJM789]|uniref:Anaphase promoting complex (APC) subunit n=1 Tax=Saccharomyces cerevisiae (strain YJM789) TaxID=307796 RepID=A6ZU65_YEAS7|nr:anaphase promoting complex (APC) subunit [Saccharomyces cerevisiae YJM789]CAI4458630.1 BDC_1c_G0019130.mRNA.1.CDS.1 [Saccharomyces cerevisiae]CAI7119073.1 BDC_1c_G0019130.mRNA.1.CDS.1 [Saccharomyces cerevisiae]